MRDPWCWYFVSKATFKHPALFPDTACNCITLDLKSSLLFFRMSYFWFHNHCGMKVKNEGLTRGMNVQKP